MTCNWASNLSLTQFSTQSHGAWVLTRSICVPMPIAHRHENTKTYTRSITLRAHHYARTRCQKEETSAKVAWSVRSHSQRPSRLQNIPPQIWLRLCWSPARKSAEPLRAVSSLKVGRPMQARENTISRMAHFSLHAMRYALLHYMVCGWVCMCVGGWVCRCVRMAHLWMLCHSS